MNESKKLISKNISDDILYHFELMLIDLNRLKIDYNRDAAIQYAVENLSKKIVTIIQLYERYDKPRFRAIKNKINQLVATNPNVKGFIIHVANTRCKNEQGTIEKFKIEI